MLYSGFDTLPRSVIRRQTGLAARITRTLCALNMEPMNQTDRFADPGDTIYSLMADEILVECPRCAKCASHRPIENDNKRDWFAPRRLVCPHCALTQDWNNRGIHRHWYQTPARDDYFNELLWIRGSLGSNEIWAYNWRHLQLIERYVAAMHRQHSRDSEFGWANKSFVNRLPKWIISSKNREKVLKTIQRVKRDRKLGT